MIAELGMEAVKAQWQALTFPDDPEQMAIILGRYGKLANVSVYDKRCPLCDRQFTKEDYGTQTYCQECAKAYRRNADWARRHGMVRLSPDGIPRSLQDKIRNQPVRVCPDCGKSHFDDRTIACCCGADLTAIPWIRNQDLGEKQNENV